jgi:uncharacterized protein DUF559
MAAVLTGGADAVLSHRSAAALWGLVGARGLIDITSSKGRPGRKGIRLHVGHLLADERTERDGIPVTIVARTLLDLGDTANEEELRRVFDEADRLNLLQASELARVYDRGAGRRGLGTCRRLIASLTTPQYTRSALEERFAEFCLAHKLPPPSLNCSVLSFVVDALWPRQRLIVELDGFAFHRHRGAFERDRARDAALQAAGYRVVRITHRRLEENEREVAEQLSRLLRGASAPRTP